MLEWFVSFSHVSVSCANDISCDDSGPARSVEVSVRCGLQNTLLSANEPSRCEYAFEFETPALCESTPGTEGEGDASAPRDEL